MGSTNGKTVLFNVGGDKYEVAKSTIEKYPDTMLAKLVSDKWQTKGDGGNNQDEAIFIDSDGSNFRFVLQYMRHNKVHLPVNTPKATVLQELEYFGFVNVPFDAISSSCANFAAAKHLRTLDADYKQINKDAQRAVDFAHISYSCFQKYYKTGSLTTNINKGIDYTTYGPNSIKGNEAELDKCLEQYGFRYIRHEGLGCGSYNMEVALLES